ncbi:MAG TPA: ABC transporter ATP-binding protein [Thermodesulfobacteriota bacterium]|nr:ABC transporter ATP-binding protein [Thermodesulfobacteriota bacterium]
MSYAIETHDLTKNFPVIKRYREMIVHPFRRKEITALQEVNIQVRKGELFGLLGPNGAGKTTLIKILCTLVLPTSGKAFVGGLDVTKEGRSIRRIIGYVISDERSFYWRLTGRQNLKFFAKLNNIPNSEADTRIDRVLEFLELADNAERMFKDYSTGMRQKLAIARGLLTNPEIIFMDEPTRSLDPITVQNLRTLVKDKIVGEEKKTVVFATHNLQEAQDICDRVGIIHKGQLKAVGSVEEIRRKLGTDKKYVMKLKALEYESLKKIISVSSVRKIRFMENGSHPDYIQIEVETADGDGSIPSLIKQIVDAGAKVYSLHEEETSLEELFSRVIDRGDRISGESIS